MCEVGSGQGEALVCDVALPVVRSALAAAGAITVRLRSEPGRGTRINLISGDPSAFERCIREAVAGADR